MMTRFRLPAVVAGFAVATGIVGPALAQAPTGSAGSEPGSTREKLPIKSTDNYEPTGLPVGSFRLFPELELDEVFNDNIYATAGGTAGKTSSFIQLVKPSASLRSDWSNHMLNFFARGGLGFYSANSTENFQDVGLGFDGRFDIQRDWNVYGGGSWSRRHEDRGTPNAITAAFPPTVYNQLAGNAGYFQKFNRFSVRLDGRIDNYIYFDNGQGFAQGVLPNSQRDRNEFREAARFGYEFSPGYEVWVRGSMNQRTYINGTDSNGYNRSSNGFDVVGGVSVDLGGITSFEAFVGYLQQNYYDYRYPTITGPTFGLIGYWNPIRELWIKPFVRRGIDDSAFTNAVAYTSTAYGLDVNYNVLPNVRLDAHADYATADYSGTVNTAPATGPNRFDQYYTLRASVMYLLTRNFYVGPQYQYTHRTSNQPNSDYDQSIVMLKLGSRF
jgi:hypothetical protein